MPNQTHLCTGKGFQDNHAEAYDPSLPLESRLQEWLHIVSVNVPSALRWGPLRHTCNVALATTVQAATLGSGKNYVTARKYRCWVRKQLNYIAGSNPAKQSYIAGYTPSNHKAADRPHHRSSSCDKNYTITCGINQLYYNGPSPNQLKGGLVGGPNNLDVFDNTRRCV